LIDLTITPEANVQSVFIPSGTEFISRVGSNTYTFSTDQDITILSNTTSFVAKNIPVYEGNYIEDTFVVDTANGYQRYILSNPTIDTTSLNVIVSENSGTNVYFYEVRSSLFDVSSNTAMCFIQAAENDKYELMFGNGISGRPPSDGSLIFTRYRLSNGSDPNGASVFVPTGSIDGHANVKVVTAISAADGAVHESVESIKFNAPRFYQTQERAVTANDYRVLLQATYPEITAINVYGGEDADPPQYSTVVIALAVAGSQQVPDYKKLEYTNYLKNRTSLSSDPVFVEPVQLYVDVDVDIKYNTGSTTKSALDIETAVRRNILQYSQTNLNDFEKTLYFSNLVKQIDLSDGSIISNDLYVKPMIKFVPAINQQNTYVLRFYNEMRRLPYSNRIHIYEDEHTIRSSSFVYEGGVCSFEDDGDGNIRIVQVSGTNHLVVKPNAGTVDYKTGVVTLTNFAPTSYEGNGISVYALSLARDIKASRNQIISIQSNDIGVNVTGERIL
jgi:hypothetical protein